MINLLFLHFPWQCLLETWKCEWDLASCQSVTKNYDFLVPKTHGCGNDYSSFHWQKSCKNIKLLCLWSWWCVLLVAQHVNCCVIQSGVFGAVDHYTGKLEKQNTSLLLTWLNCLMYTFLFSFTALPISANLRIPDQTSNSIEVKSKQFAIFNELEISRLAPLGFSLSLVNADFWYGQMKFGLHDLIMFALIKRIYCLFPKIWLPCFF